MFLIAGVSPRIKILDQTPRICPSCGLAQARLKRVDSYFNLFFIPILKVKTGEPFIGCERCENMSAGFYPGENSAPIGTDLQCARCGGTLYENFQYCPHCGNKL